MEQKPKLKKLVRWSLIGAAVVVLAALLINPRLTNPPLIAGQDLTATNSPPAEIVKLIHNACYDCHSDETKWPWYSHVAPVSWWLVEHVEDGRKRLNFSKWPHDDTRRAVRRWRSIAEAVREGEMPFPNYDRMHPAARLTQEQRDKLSQWAEQEADRLRPETEEKTEP
jgi:hypothetical protein